MAGAINFYKNDDYYTPKSLLDLVNRGGQFDYDPATTKDQSEYLGIPNYDTIETDGLKSDWSKYKCIWINPPFTMKGEFLAKAVKTYMSSKNDIYILLPISYLTTKSFHKTIGDIGYKLYLPSGRVKFISGLTGRAKSPAFGSVVILLQQEKEIQPIDID